MRTLLTLTAFTIVVACTACSLLTPAQPSKEPVTTSYKEARFVPVSPQQPDGPRIAILWGDPAIGTSAMLLELRKGSLQLHTHTADYHLVVVEGEVKHWSENESEAGAKVLGPGSYWFQPGGKVHGDACLTDRCVVHIVWAGPRDGKLALPGKN